MESLDDLSNGGRVTRSLRKRLTSVDSNDAGSRPTTPQLTKLGVIPETSSPSRAVRATRRNSITGIGTPIKASSRPKTSAIYETNEIDALKRSEESVVIRKGTPARRSARLPSKTSPQLEEEKTPRSGATKKLKPGPKSRRSRQLSESDSDVEVIDFAESTEKTNSRMLKIEDNQTSNPLRVSPRLKAKSVSPKIEQTINLSKEIVHIHDKNATEEDLRIQENVEDIQNIIDNADSKNKLTEKSDDSKVTFVQVSKSNSCLKSPIKANVESDINSINDSTINLEKSNIRSQSQICFTEKTPEKCTLPETNIVNTKDQDGSFVESIVMIPKLSPNVIAKLCAEYSITNSPPKTKSVAFNDIGDNDEMVKSTFPKTPASIKSKSYIALDSSKESVETSFQSDKGSSISFKDASAYIDECKEQRDIQKQENQSKESVEFHDATHCLEEDNFENAEEMIQVCTPLKQQLNMKLQSSTPMVDSVTSIPEPERNLENVEGKVMSVTSPYKTSPMKSTQTSNTNFKNTAVEEKRVPIILDKEKPLSIEPQKPDSASKGDDHVTSNVKVPINSNDIGVDENLFSKSWTHNVTGCATSVGKIDTITFPASANKNEREKASERMCLISNQISSPSVDAKEAINEECEEEDSFQKLEFIDDEAMEASDDYESGDSMDEEERRDIEENEILDGGESIGSEDTVSDGSNEDADENASFITSDSQISQHDSDGDENFKNSSKKSNRLQGNNHILITSESEMEGEGEKESSNENDVKVKTNINSEKKAKRFIKSIRKNRISETSESENEDASASKLSNQENETDKDSQISSKPLDFEISRMIDESTDEESVNKISSKAQSASDKTDIRKIIKLIDQTQVVNSDKCRKQDSDELVNAVKNDLLKPNADNIDEGSDNELSNSSVNQESETTAKSTAQANLANTSVNTLERSLREKISKSFGLVCGIYSKSDVNGNDQSVKTNIPLISAKPKEIEETLAVPEQIPTRVSDKTSILLNNSELNISTKKQMQGVSKSNDKNALNQSKSSIDLYVNDYTVDEDIEIPETQEVEQSFDGTDKNELEFPDENAAEIAKPKNSSLSVSFCQPKKRRNSICKKVQHTSFTHGVGIIELESDKKRSIDDNSSSESETENKPETNIDKEEEDELEKLLQTEQKFAILNRKRKSLASFDAWDCKELKSKKKNRKSLQSISRDEFNPSQSLIENIEDRKLELQTQKGTIRSRLSKSFCGAVQDNGNTTTDNSASDTSESGNEKETNSASRHSNINKKKEIGHILSRCDEILEAANSAKLESKKNYKKSMVLCPKSKKSSNHSALMEEESENDGQFEKQSKEKTAMALEQAFKASAKILMSEVGKIKRENFQINEEENIGKRLPVEVLESLSNFELAQGAKKNHTETRSAFVQRMNCATGEIVEEALSPPRKKRAILNKFELATGTVFEEPVTPKKERNIGGFRESPITPRTVGFKVRNILTAGQDLAPELRSSHQRKRKQKIDEPKHVLPKPQWSQSGVFLEEFLPSVNDKQKHKLKDGISTQKYGTDAAAATINALNFKNSTMFRKNVVRESAHEALKHKERQFARKNF